MSKEMQIEVITYDQDRLNYFTDLMKKAQKRYERLYKKFANSPYLWEGTERLNDAGRELQFYRDVVAMLEQGYRKPSENVIELPCNVGDTVYYINTYYHIELYRNTIYEAKVVRFVVTGRDVSFILHIKYHNGLCETPVIDAFGKTVFLTKEEAEQALKRMGG